MNNGTYVMMPVMCIGKMCKNCPNLNVDTSVSELFANGESVGCETELKCRGLQRCLKLQAMMEKYWENEHDKRT